MQHYPILCALFSEYKGFVRYVRVCVCVCAPGLYLVTEYLRTLPNLRIVYVLFPTLNLRRENEAARDMVDGSGRKSRDIVRNECPNAGDRMMSR